MVNTETYSQLKATFTEKNITLVAVSKLKPVADIQALYELGQRDFGENYVQELTEKEQLLPKDIRWHFIGHLQTNKVKYIAPFVHLIHGIDSYKLLKEINKQGQKNNKVIQVLLQIHIAQEETKFGMNEKELDEALTQWVDEKLNNVAICGLMGMASYSEDKVQVKKEFAFLHSLFERYRIQFPSLNILSMGMSGDYQLAVTEGSTMVRVGSLLFGARK